MLSKLPERKSLSKTVLEKLRVAILERKIPSGTRLVGRALAEEMGISRTPVHEALNVLVSEKLVKKTRNNGFVVARIEKKDIIQLYTMRLHLETLAVQWALPNLSPKLIDRLKKNVARSEKYSLKSDTKRISETNAQFHQIILSAAQNHILADFIELLHRNAKLFRVHSANLSGRSEKIVAEHEKIIDALESRDEAQAAAAIRGHLSNALNSILSALGPREEEIITNE